ncbi:N-acetylglucosamine kinase [Arthrobacter sp. L77]|uniref:N-acetylglucosamine kinase n=1 Tax=Arthrobacter sp. L77 TaxID=1496689 RepID=UPI0006916A16|nr:BadF/BadG/BcrA/BcrD ATPase family protein [Arthrobacter sp. L77]
MAEHARLVCGVDVGGSGCRVAVVPAAAPDGRPSSYPRFQGPGLDIGRNGVDATGLLASLAPLVAQARAAAGGGDITAIAVGAASVASLLEDVAALHDGLRAISGASLTFVASDIVTSHLGALGGEPGVVVAAGTGAIALGTDHHTRWHCADGWGHLLGDVGSGAWVGRRALETALRAHDGRAGGSPALLASLTGQFGSPDQLVSGLYSSPNRSAVLASFVPATAAAAHDGDPVASGILRHAGAELAGTCSAAFVPGLPLTVAWTGGLFEASPLVLAAFSEHLTALRPGVRLTPASGTSLDGAMGLAAAGALGRGTLQDRPPFLTSVRHELSAARRMPGSRLEA